MSPALQRPPVLAVNAPEGRLGIGRRFPWPLQWRLSAGSSSGHRFIARDRIGGAARSISPTTPCDQPLHLLPKSQSEPTSWGGGRRRRRRRFQWRWLGNGGGIEPTRLPQDDGRHSPGPPLRWLRPLHRLPLATLHLSVILFWQQPVRILHVRHPHSLEPRAHPINQSTIKPPILTPSYSPAICLYTHKKKYFQSLGLSIEFCLHTHGNFQLLDSPIITVSTTPTRILSINPGFIDRSGNLGRAAICLYTHENSCSGVHRSQFVSTLLKISVHASIDRNLSRHPPRILAPEFIDRNLSLHPPGLPPPAFIDQNLPLYPRNF